MLDENKNQQDDSKYNLDIPKFFFGETVEINGKNFLYADGEIDLSNEPEAINWPLSVFPNQYVYSEFYDDVIIRFKIKSTDTIDVIYDENLDGDIRVKYFSAEFNNQRHKIYKKKIFGKYDVLEFSNEDNFRIKFLHEIGPIKDIGAALSPAINELNYIHTYVEGELSKQFNVAKEYEIADNKAEEEFERKHRPFDYLGTKYKCINDIPFIPLNDLMDMNAVLLMQVEEVKVVQDVQNDVIINPYFTLKVISKSQISAKFSLTHQDFGNSLYGDLIYSCLLGCLSKEKDITISNTYYNNDSCYIEFIVSITGNNLPDMLNKLIKIVKLNRLW